MHTPGPWIFKGERMRHDSSRVIHGPTCHVAYAADYNQHKLDDEVDANARLIAAAPRMLEYIRENASHTCIHEDTRPKCPRCAARAILRDIEGKE